MDNCAGAVENRAGLNLKRRRKEEIMSNRLFQGVIHQMRDSIDRTIGVIDESSVIIACSELGKIGEVTESVTAEDIASQAAFVSGNYTYKSFGSRPRPEYAVFVSGNDPEAAKYVGLLAVSLNSIKQYYDEKYDRSNFIKNGAFNALIYDGGKQHDAAVYGKHQLAHGKMAQAMIEQTCDHVRAAGRGTAHKDE